MILNISYLILDGLFGFLVLRTVRSVPLIFPKFCLIVQDIDFATSGEHFLTTYINSLLLRTILNFAMTLGNLSSFD